MLTIESISKTYADGAEALRSVSLELPQGAITAVIGGSGCGKTTLLRLIAGLDQVSGGRIADGGGNIAAAHSAAGSVLQEPRLFPWLRVVEQAGSGSGSLA